MRQKKDFLKVQSERKPMKNREIGRTGFIKKTEVELENLRMNALETGG